MLERSDKHCIQALKILKAAAEEKLHRGGKKIIANFSSEIYQAWGKSRDVFRVLEEKNQ